MGPNISQVLLYAYPCPNFFEDAASNTHSRVLIHVHVWASQLKTCFDVTLNLKQLEILLGKEMIYSIQYALGGHRTHKLFCHLYHSK